SPWAGGGGGAAQSLNPSARRGATRWGGGPHPSTSMADADSARPQLTGGEIRTLRKLMQSNERKMETLRGKVEDARALMVAADPTDFGALGDFQAQINDLQGQVDVLEEEWLEAAETLGE
ncbi:MAG: ABC transporter ATP-binding protein, partial [Gordonibacter sp.]